MPSPIVLLTDFGQRDSYVGVMKGVIAGIAPGATVIDLSHEIRPQDVAHAAYTLGVAAPYFPDGSIFCCVVDPGVGSARRAVALRVGRWTVIAPDNGLATRLLDGHGAHEAILLDEPRFQLESPSATFHGRDRFAPAAAHLAAGVPLPALGSALDVASLVALPPLVREPLGDGWRGAVQHIDRFGNLVSTLHARDLVELAGWRVALPGAALAIPRIHRTYADVPPGEPLAYIGSDGFLELAIREGNAAERWGAAVGDAVLATREDAI